MANEYLQKDEKWFEQNRQDLLTNHRGKWIVIYNQESLGYFNSFKEAYNFGVENSGSEDISVRQVTEENEPLEDSINLCLGLLNAPTYS